MSSTEIRMEKYFGSDSTTTYSLHEYTPMLCMCCCLRSQWIWILILHLRWAYLPLWYITSFSNVTKCEATQCLALQLSATCYNDQRKVHYLLAAEYPELPPEVHHLNTELEDRDNHHSCTVFLAVCHPSSFCVLKICCTYYSGAFILLRKWSGKKNKNH